MARTNKRASSPKVKTHEGGKATRANALQSLRRSVMGCLLWEDTFYEDGELVANRIIAAAKEVTPRQLADVAIEARKVYNLRHVPLLLCSVLCQTGAGDGMVSDTIARVIGRADELAEFVAVYARLNNVPPSAVKAKLSAQAKKGLAKAFIQFDAYQLGK
jgi:60 kDa SS-A/Ro ribonucleoprotein